MPAGYGVVVVEDNASSAWDPSGPEIPPLAAFAPPHAEVLTIGSVSKAVWGGLRIGWIRAPRPLAERPARHKALRVPFSYPDEVMADAVDRMARAWQELRRHGPAPAVPLV